MRKGFVLSIVFLLVVILVGCGTSTVSEPTSIETFISTEKETEPPTEVPTAPSLDSVIEEVLSYAERNDKVIGEDAESAITDEYTKGNYDSYSIYSLLCDNCIFTDKPESGILVMNVDYGNNYDVFTVKLDLINPSTGNVTNFKTFSSNSSSSCWFNEQVYNTVDARACFSEDFTKLSARRVIDSDGSRHVGWINEQGTFTDVSSAITSTSDFSGAVKHFNPCFGQDGYFYFYDEGDDTVKRVPIDNISKDSVETVFEDPEHDYFHLNPDGSISDNIWYYYDSSMEYPAYKINFYDWINEKEFLGQNTNKNAIYKYEITSSDIKKYPFGGNSEDESIVPSVSGRYNRDPILSPDGETVAFLSQLTSGNDYTSSLYTVPLGTDEEPTKINVNYNFDPKETKYPIEYIILFDWI